MFRSRGSEGGRAAYPVGRRWIVGLAFAVSPLVFVASACGDNDGSDDVTGATGDDAEGTTDAETIRLVTINAVDSLSVVAAQEQGFFEREGLDVELTVQPNHALFPPLIGNQFDVGFSLAPLIISGANEGLPIEVIAGNTFDSPDVDNLQVVARPDVANLQDMGGRRLAVPSLTGNASLAVRAWLEDNDVDANSVELVQVNLPQMVDQLQAGQVDAATLVYPFTDIATSQGMTSFGSPYGFVLAENTPTTFWISDTDWVADHENAVTNFRSALADGMEWITSNEAEARDLLAEFTGVEPESVQDVPLDQFSADISPSDLELWGDLMVTFDGFEATVDYEDMVAPVATE